VIVGGVTMVVCVGCDFFINPNSFHQTGSFLLRHHDLVNPNNHGVHKKLPKEKGK
jgi:hypothetical protein